MQPKMCLYIEVYVLCTCNFCWYGWQLNNFKIVLMFLTRFSSPLWAVGCKVPGFMCWFWCYINCLLCVYLTPFFLLYFLLSLCFLFILIYFILRHLDRFSHFCRAQERDQQTDSNRLTDHAKHGNMKIASFYSIVVLLLFQSSTSCCLISLIFLKCNSYSHGYGLPKSCN